MTKEKQIEVIAHIMCGIEDSCDECIYKLQCYERIDAEQIYNADYRKASEVARDIFEEIEREIKNHGICYAQRKIAELKKKYTEEQSNDR